MEKTVAIQGLMTVVAEHGTGDDIRVLSELAKNAGQTVKVEYKPLMQIKDTDTDNVYDGLNFTPDLTFRRLQKHRDNRPEGNLLEHMQDVLQDQMVVEQCAVLFLMMVQSLPPLIVKTALGGRPRQE